MPRVSCSLVGRRPMATQGRLARRPPPHEPKSPQARPCSKYLKCFDLAVDLRFTSAALSSFRLRHIVTAETEALWPPHLPILQSRSIQRLWTRPVALVSGRRRGSTEVS